MRAQNWKLHDSAEDVYLEAEMITSPIVMYSENNFHIELRAHTTSGHFI